MTRAITILLLGVAVFGPGQRTPSDADLRPVRTSNDGFRLESESGMRAFSMALDASGRRVIRQNDLLVVSDLPEPRLRPRIDAAAAAEDILAAWLGPVQGPAPHAILLFENPERHRAIAACCGHDPAKPALIGASGFFSRSCGLVHLGYVPDHLDPDAALRAIAHECLHQGLWLRGLAVPKERGGWIEEGLATLLESKVPAPGADPGAVERVAEALALLDTPDFIPVRDFVDLDGASLRGLPPERLVFGLNGLVFTRYVSVYQVEAFAVATFIEGRLGARFPAFLRQAVRDGATASLCANALQLPIDRLEPSLREDLKAKWTQR
jgi:hypothetical protein